MKQSFLLIIMSIVSICAFSQPDEKLLQKAKNGSAKAQHEVAYYYDIHGDNDNAIIWYRKSAEQGYKDSYYWLSELLRKSGNYVEAARWWKQMSLANTKGSKFAEFELGDYYKEGKGGEKDYQEAYYWYEKSLVKTHGIWGTSTCQLAIYDMAVCKDSIGEYKDALKWYTEAYNGIYDGFGSQPSTRINSLAGMIRILYLGLGVDKNIPEVKRLVSFIENELYKNPHEISVGKVFTSFAYRYMHINNDNADKEMTLFWLKVALSYKDSDAGYLLGTIFENGLYGNHIDVEESMKWYQYASNLGCLKSLLRIGDLYEKGTDFSQDLQKAFENYQYILKKGVEEIDHETIIKAKGHLGVMYYNEYFVKHNPDKAFSFLYDATSDENAINLFSDYPVVFRTIAQCYRYKVGTPENPVLSEYWDNKAQELGDNVAILLNQIRTMEEKNRNEVDSILK